MATNVCTAAGRASVSRLAVRHSPRRYLGGNRPSQVLCEIRGQDVAGRPARAGVDEAVEMKATMKTAMTKLAAAPTAAKTGPKAMMADAKTNTSARQFTITAADLAFMWRPRTVRDSMGSFVCQIICNADKARFAGILGVLRRFWYRLKNVRSKK